MSWLLRRILTEESQERVLKSRVLFEMVGKYEPKPSLWPYALLNVAGFYTGIIAAAVHEQLYKERYWAEHPGEAVPTLRPWVYLGSHKIRRSDFADSEQEQGGS